MHKAKEDLLVIAAQRGNEQAFTFLCKYYQASLLRFAYKLCTDHQIAQDAVQDAWIKISRKLITLNDPRAFKSWIFRAVRWRVYDLMRQSLHQDELVEQKTLEQVATPQNKDSEHSDNLIALIDRLPAIDKQAIYLFYLEEMKISEIASVLQIPSGTVKSRLSRARKSLREQANS